MIDTHTHLSDLKFSEDLPLVLARAKNNGIKTFINPATNVDDAQRILEITQEHKDVYGLVGIYPGEAETDNWEGQLSQLRTMLLHNSKIVGIGEIGLDEKPYLANPEFEKRIFEAQLEMALELDYPVVIHTRNTEEVMWEVLKKYEVLPPGHFHCFSGSTEWLEYVLSRGFYVGFDGNVTYPSAQNLRELAKRVPIERLLLETDSPYLPPQGKRGERNEPANVKITAEFLAQLRGETVEQLIKKTTENARLLFRI